MKAAIEHNTTLLNRLGADAVPYIVTRDPQGGARMAGGAMPTDQLARFIGLGAN